MVHHGRINIEHQKTAHYKYAGFQQITDLSWLQYSLCHTTSALQNKYNVTGDYYYYTLRIENIQRTKLESRLQKI